MYAFPNQWKDDMLVIFKVSSYVGGIGIVALALQFIGLSELAEAGTIDATTLIPLGSTAAGIIILAGLVWKVATWVATIRQMEGRLERLEQKYRD